MSHCGSGIECPLCAETCNIVIESRKIKNAIRRRRQCEACGERFTTIESIGQPSKIKKPQLQRVDMLKRYIKEIEEKCSYIKSVLSSN